MKPKLSIVVPMHNESQNALVFYERVKLVLDGMPNLDLWEIVAVNDGSKDDTLNHLIQIYQKDSRFKVVDLSRNFGKEAALTAGIEFASGGAVIPIDADLQDPPEVIPELVKKWEEGFDVVNAVREERAGETAVKKGTAHLFYRLFNKMSHVKIPEDTGDFRLLSRKAVEALKAMPERRRFMKGLFAWVGFKTTEIKYFRDARLAGETSFNYWKLWNFALDGITSFSTFPLRICSYLGLGVAFLALIYAAIIIAKTLLYGDQVKGYPSLMAVVLFIGGIQLIGLGIIGEYLGRVYEETKQRPIYLTKQVYGFGEDA
jgi:glycosyltransferase involved in cell wall biosynthesis